MVTCNDYYQDRIKCPRMHTNSSWKWWFLPCSNLLSFCTSDILFCPGNTSMSQDVHHLLRNLRNALLRLENVLLSSTITFSATDKCLHFFSFPLRIGENTLCVSAFILISTDNIVQSLMSRLLEKILTKRTKSNVLDSLQCRLSILISSDRLYETTVQKRTWSHQSPGPPNGPKYDVELN